MTGLELLKAPGTTAGEIADIVAEHCPPVVPTECDNITCRECWLSWLTTGEPPAESGKDILVPKAEGAPENRVPLEWEPRFVTACGINVSGKRYSSNELMAYVGKRILVHYAPETITARTEDGREIGNLTLYLE